MILFITRKYPPSIGGMQRYSYKLATHLAQKADIQVIAWGKSQIFLPIFLPLALFRAILALSRQTVSIVHLGDPVLCPIGMLLRMLYHVPVVVTLHGRDLVFSNKLYQWVISRCLKRVDRVICVSEALRNEAIRRGVPAERCEAIPNGVDVSDFDTLSCQRWPRVLQPLHQVRGSKRLLVTVGRLVKKKGVQHFISMVLPELLKRSSDVCYVVVGDGPLRAEIERLVRTDGLEGKVFLLGKVAMEGDALPTLFRLADVFVMPNIPVEGDFEGFGIAALEAAAAGLCVVASRTDGIPSAIIDGKNGFLVRPYDVDGYVETIWNLLQDSEGRERFGQRAREFTAENYSWQRTAGAYLASFQQVIAENPIG